MVISTLDETWIDREHSTRSSDPWNYFECPISRADDVPIERNWDRLKAETLLFPSVLKPDLEDIKISRYRDFKLGPRDPNIQNSKSVKVSLRSGVATVLGTCFVLRRTFGLGLIPARLFFKKQTVGSNDTTRFPSSPSPCPILWQRFSCDLSFSEGPQGEAGSLFSPHSTGCSSEGMHQCPASLQVGRLYQKLRAYTLLRWLFMAYLFKETFVAFLIEFSGLCDKLIETGWLPVVPPLVISLENCRKNIKVVTQGNKDLKMNLFAECLSEGLVLIFF